MTARASILATALAVALLAVPAAAQTVTARFEAPERYTDRDFRIPSRRDATLAEFARFFAGLGERTLKPGQSVAITVLDIDLAGDYEPWRPQWGDVRILRDVTPPRFRMRYVMRDGRRVVLEGEETVSDMNYLMNPSARGSSRRFVYEKDMLTDWFRDRFVRMRPVPRGWSFGG